MARRIAEGLDHHPEWLELAKNNLRRWRSHNANAPSLLRCYDEWEEILQLPVVEIRAVLTDESDNGQRLRQSSPFAGVLSPQEVWRLKSEARR